MHTVSRPSFSVNEIPTVAEQAELRGSFGHPADELTLADHEFLQSLYVHDLSEQEMDNLFCEEMERRDAERAARKLEIIRSISRASRNRFAAAVEVNGHTHKLGIFRAEGKAEQAIDAYIRAIRAGEVAA